MNITDLIEDLPSQEGRKIRKRTKRSLPETFDYWEKEVGLSTPRDQAACGSCWSFPNVSLCSYYSLRKTLNSLMHEGILETGDF